MQPRDNAATSPWAAARDKSPSSLDRGPIRSGDDAVPHLSGIDFGYLREHEEQLVRLGLLAKRCLVEHPRLALAQLTQFVDLLAQLIAAKVGLFVSRGKHPPRFFAACQDHGILPSEVARLFDAIRRTSRDVDDSKTSDASAAIVAMRLTQQLGLWFHRTFSDQPSSPLCPPTR